MDSLTIILLILFLFTSSLDVIMFIWIRYFYLEPRTESKKTVRAVKQLVTQVDRKNNLAQQDAELLDLVSCIDSIKELVN